MKRFLTLLLLAVGLLALPVAALAQVTEPQSDAWYLQLLGLAMPVILPFANRYVFEAIQSIANFLEELPALAKQLLVVAQSYGLTHLAVILGVPLPEQLSGFTGETSLAVLTALAAIGMHKLAKDKEKALKPA